MTIRELNISARSKSCLMSAGYKEVEDLRDVSDETLSEIRNLNQACVAEIRKAIDEYFSDAEVDDIDLFDDVDLLDDADSDDDLVDGDFLDIFCTADIGEIGDDEPGSKPSDVMEWDIDELELSIRSYNCLKRAGINTVRELCNKTLDDMMRVHNLGRRSLAEVLTKLNELGLKLKDEQSDDEVDGHTSTIDADMSTSIEKLELSLRSTRYLERAGINTVGDLCNRTIDDVRWVRNLGRKSFEEILGKMNELGLQFKETPKVDLPESVDETVDLSMLIINLELSSRTKNWLRRRKIETVKDLCSITEETFDKDRFLARSKNEIQILMSQLGIGFRPVDEDSCLYLYPESVKKIAAEKEDSWEHRLFIEAAIVNYSWLSQYRKLVPELWAYEDEEDRIDSRSKLVELLHEKMDEIKDYIEQIAECMKTDIVDSFGSPGESGDVQEIIASTEKLMGIYKSVIRSRYSFRFIDADMEYRMIITSMCEAYESLCKNIDVFYQKLLVAKKQFEDLLVGEISGEDLTIDLNITFELDMDDLSVALDELNGESSQDDVGDEFEDITILDSDTFRVDFCGIDFDTDGETLEIKIWVKNSSGGKRKVWAKDVYVNDNLVESIDILGSVDDDGYGYAYEEISSVDGIDFEDYEEVKFTIEIDDMDNHEMEFSQTVTVRVMPLLEMFEVMSVEDYIDEEDFEEEDDEDDSQE